MKNDTRDAEDLADPLRLGRLAEAWVARPRCASFVSSFATGRNSPPCAAA